MRLCTNGYQRRTLLHVKKEANSTKILVELERTCRLVARKKWGRKQSNLTTGGILQPPRPFLFSGSSPICSYTIYSYPLPRFEFTLSSAPI